MIGGKAADLRITINLPDAVRRLLTTTTPEDATP